MLPEPLCTSGRARMGWLVACVACAVTTQACAPIAFQMPTLPPFGGAAITPVTAPAPDAVPIPLPTGSTAAIEEARAADARFAQTDVLAIGPVGAADGDLAPELLRRLLKRGGMRLLDLTGAGSLTVQIRAATADESAPTVTGPLMAAAWATRLGSATHLLVSTAPVLEQGSAFMRTTQRFQPGALDAYDASYQGALVQCSALGGQVGAARASFRQAFDEAMARYEEGRRRPFDFSPDEAPGAREEFAIRQAQIHPSQNCLTLPTPAALRALEGAELPPTSREVTRARWDVRIVEVPGGRVVWAARVSHEGADRTMVLNAMIETLLDALPWTVRAASRTGGRAR